MADPGTKAQKRNQSVQENDRQVSFSVGCVAGGIVRVRGKILTAESEYGRRSHEENGKEPLVLVAKPPLKPPLPRVGLARAPPPATQAIFSDARVLFAWHVEG